jgi:parallel beta-helix repeat protein
MFFTARYASRTRNASGPWGAWGGRGRPVVALAVAALVCAILATSAVPAQAAGRPSRPTHVSARLSGPPARVAVWWWHTPGALAYRVFRNGRLLAPHLRWAHYADPSILPAKTYYYRVEACSPAHGCSAWSSAVRVRTPAAMPRAPAWIKARRAESGVLVDWPASERATKYRVMRDGRLFARHILRTQFLVAHASAARGHTFSTRACNALGCSPRSNGFVVPGSAPPSPTGVSAVANGTTRVAISWRASQSASDYRLFRNGNLVQATITSTNTVDAPVAPATRYVYFLKACNADRCSSPSDAVAVDTPDAASPPPPPEPAGLTVDSSSATEVRLAWNPVSEATEYRLYREGILLSSSSDANFVDDTVSPGSLYFYMVSACTETVCSFPSAPVVVKTPGPAIICSGVNVSPSSDLQAVVNSKPTGTTFCLGPGTYSVTGTGVLVRSNDTLIGQPGTILDGGGSATYGVYGYGTDAGQKNVTIKGLTLRNFASQAIKAGWGWTMEGNDIGNSVKGVSLSTGSVLRGNYIHDNARYGIVGGWGRDILIEGNEVARNNTSRDCGGTCVGDAGGSKIVGISAGTYGLVWRGNWVHDNYGPGIWSDINVREALYENNLVQNNTGSGIFHEISWYGTIRNNVVRDNATDYVGKSCAWAAQIHMNNAQHVEVYGNTVSAPRGGNGICAVDMDRTDPSYCPTALGDISVHDNTLKLPGRSRSGFAGDAADRISFDRDSYYVGDVESAYWNWARRLLTWPQLHARSQEVQGTLRPLA